MVRLIVTLALMLAVMQVMPLAQTVQSVTGGRLAGGQVTVSAGASRGVKAGMNAKVMAWEGSGEQRHEVPIANIEVVTVSESACTAKILAVGQGYAVQKGMRVAFTAKLGPPPASGATSAAKRGGGEAAREPAGKLPDLNRLTPSQKLELARRLLAKQRYAEAVRVFEAVAREVPDPVLYAEDYDTAQRLLAEQEERARRAQAEKAEVEAIRRDLPLYRELVARYEKTDLAKAVEYQRTICLADESPAAKEKLAELEYRLAVSKLPARVYPEHIQEIAAKYPERSREMQEKARQNAAAREARAAEERQRAEDARRQAEEAKRARERAVWDSFQFVTIAPGSFMMGSKEGEGNEKPVHEVRITRSFALQVTEVTQGQWQAVMGSNPSHFYCCDDCPVESVSWDDVQAFIRKLNALDPGKGYRLPTEAEWEYACRAGSTGERYGDLDSIAWYDANSDGRTPVKRKRPNDWGLYDMLGNVWKWCQDWCDGQYYKQFKKVPAVDPTGPVSGSITVIRGGGWNGNAVFCRSAARFGRVPDYRNSLLPLGFRLARSLP